MSKRQKFIFTSIVLSLGMIFVQDVDIGYRYQAISVLAILCLFLTFWSLREALAGVGWIMTIILPLFFTGGVGFFYFLLPQTFIARLPIAALYAVGMYALLLTENIFSVAAIRTIQLFRAAQAVGFILTLFTLFLVLDTIFSFRFSFWLNAILVFVSTFFLFLQGLWSINLEEKLSKKILSYTFFLSLIVSQMALVLSFWPLTITLRSVAITTYSYVLLGLSQAEFQERLFKQTFWEYLSVGVLILLILILTTHWGG